MHYNYGKIASLDCEDGDVRLAGGNSHLEGRVEVCHSRVWGTVCSNSWGMEDAMVVCRQIYASTGMSTSYYRF